jgi:hypothetical protein
MQCNREKGPGREEEEVREGRRLGREEGGES